MENSTGKLYLVPTPIGNLEDITLRAIRILKQVDLILAEDTRTTKRLLTHLEIDQPIKSYHIFNEHQTVDTIVSSLQKGQRIALVSDAGTPSISDPGFLLTRAALEANVEVECLPGPCSPIVALVNSGLPSDRFVFEGFLPKKKGRQTRLRLLAEEERTMLIFESPFRLTKTLSDLQTHFGEQRKACVSRELTKLYEENVRGSLQELVTHFSSKKVKGEIVISVAGKSAKSKAG